MAAWDQIDPEDIVDLWFDLSAAPEGSKSFIPAGVTITSHTVTAPTTPPGLVLGASALTGSKVRFRTGPSPEGDYKVKCHVVLDNGEHRDVESLLRVRQRIIR